MQYSEKRDTDRKEVLKESKREKERKRKRQRERADIERYIPFFVYYLYSVSYPSAVLYLFFLAE